MFIAQSHSIFIKKKKKTVKNNEQNKNNSIFQIDLE